MPRTAHQQRSENMKVLIVDDSAVVRAALIKLLASIEQIEIIGQASGAAEAIRVIRKLRPDAVILDIHLPDRSGLEVLKIVKRSKRAPMVVVLTNSAYPELKKKCLDTGAEFFLDKAKEFEQLLQIFGGSSDQVLTK